MMEVVEELDRCAIPGDLAIKLPERFKFNQSLPEDSEVTEPASSGRKTSPFMAIARVVTALSLAGLFSLVALMFNDWRKTSASPPQIKPDDVLELQELHLLRDVRHTLMSRDGCRFIGASYHRVIAWNPKSGDKVWVWPEKAGVRSIEDSPGITCCALSPSNRWLAIGDASGKVTVLHAQTGKEEMTLTKGVQAQVSALAFSRDDKLLAVGTIKQSIDMWEWRVAKDISNGAGRYAHAAEVLTLAFSPDGKYLASGGADKAILLRRVKPFGYYEHWRPHHSGIEKVVFSPNGDWIVSAGTDGKVAISNIRSKRSYYALRQPQRVRQLFVTDDNRAVACFTEDGVGRFFDCNSWRLIETTLRMKMKTLRCFPLQRKIGSWYLTERTLPLRASMAESSYLTQIPKRSVTSTLARKSPTKRNRCR